MRPHLVAMTIGAVLAAQRILAEAPVRSLSPLARPVADTRPDFAVFVTSTAGVSRSVLPVARPAVRRRSVAGAPQLPVGVQPVQVPVPVAVATRRGSICGVRAIRGERLAPIAGTLRGCGVADPVRVASVAGVALSPPAIMNCPTAKALNKLVKSGVNPIVARLGGGVASLRVAADYSCRTRNNRSGAKVSEHGKGCAIDISAIILKNGTSLTVLTGWPDRIQGKLLKKMHKAACGPFTTVLGPNSDRFHRDHFHLDTARNSGGRYCR